jgi:hypothetical protein
MKTLRRWLAVSFLLTGCAFAQENSAPPLRSPAELEQLLAPIALYPDALIALILPAATNPTDIVLAARHLRELPGDRSQIEHRAWDESVKSLTNYPEVVTWMDENLDWVKQVGQTFVTQPADVMQAVQRLRAKARANGSLIDTPQQQVLADTGAIRIVPAQPDIIYVPRYEPDIVFVDRPVYQYAYGRPFFTFGVGVAVGSWLAFDCDWHRNTIWVGNRQRPWVGHDWHRPVVAYVPPAPNRPVSAVVRAWQPPAMRPGFAQPPAYVRPAPVVLPTIIGTPARRSSESAMSYAPSHRSAPTVIAPDNNYVSSTTSPRLPGNRGRATTGTVAPPLPSLPPLTSTVPPANPPQAPTVRSPAERPVGPDTHYRGHRSPTPSPAATPAAPAAPVAANVPPHRGNRYSPPPPSPAVSAPAPANAPAAPAASSSAPTSAPPAHGDRRGGRRPDNS